ncbi:MAG: hypothetical protein K2M93_03385 [Muribaculaceae bacterium]|nr:hypothetical protein [Muribaculaceae bacterium]
MKKFLLSLAVLAFGANVMMAEEPIASIEFTKNSTEYAKVGGYNKEWSSNDGMWKFSAFNNNNNGWDFIAAGWKSGDSTPTIASGVVCPVEVSSIVITIADRLTPSALSSAVLYVADNAEFTNSTSTALTVPTEKNSDWVIDVASPAANKFYKIEFSIPQQTDNGKAISISKIALYKNKVTAPDPVETTSVKNIKEVIATASGTKVKVDFPLTVAFKNFSNVFAFDANGDFIQVYGSNNYEVLDVIPAGWEATYDFYQSTTPELKPAGTLPASTAKGEFTPKTVAAADITTAMVNQVVLIKNVVLAEASPADKANFTGTADGVDLSLRNNYTLPSVEAGTYDITVVVTVYQNAPSLYVTNYAVAGGSAVTEIEAEAGEAVYFNLQGVKVANPEKGLYIKVEGDKATKVIF